MALGFELDLLRPSCFTVFEGKAGARGGDLKPGLQLLGFSSWVSALGFRLLGFSSWALALGRKLLGVSSWDLDLGI